jgi:hypothetical protein
LPDSGSRFDLHVSRHHPGGDGPARAARLCAHRDRLGTHVDPPHQDSGANLSVNPARSTGPAIFVGG